MQPLMLTAPTRRGPSVYEQILGAAAGSFAGAVAGRAGGALGRRIFGPDAAEVFQERQLKILEEESAARVAASKLDQKHKAELHPQQKALVEAQLRQMNEQAENLRFQREFETKNLELKIDMFEAEKAGNRDKLLQARNEFNKMHELAVQRLGMEKVAQAEAVVQNAFNRQMQVDENARRWQDHDAKMSGTGPYGPQEVVGGPRNFGGGGGTAAGPKFDDVTSVNTALEQQFGGLFDSFGGEYRNPQEQAVARSNFIVRAVDAYASQLGIDPNTVGQQPVNMRALHATANQLRTNAVAGDDTVGTTTSGRVDAKGTRLDEQGKPIRREPLTSLPGRVIGKVAQVGKERELASEAQGAQYGAGWLVGADEIDPATIKRLAAEQVGEQSFLENYLGGLDTMFGGTPIGLGIKAHKGAFNAVSDLVGRVSPSVQTLAERAPGAIGNAAEGGSFARDMLGPSSAPQVQEINGIPHALIEIPDDQLPNLLQSTNPAMLLQPDPRYQAQDIYERLLPRQ